MKAERTIIGAVAVILLISTINALINNRFSYRIVFGAGGVLLVLAIVAQGGEKAAEFAAALAMLTAGTVVLEQGGEIIGLFGDLSGGSGGSGGSSGIHNRSSTPPGGAPSTIRR